MRKLLLLSSFCFVTLLQAQVSKTINVTTAGTLTTLLTATDLTTVTNLTVTGLIDSLDFITMRSMSALKVLDLSAANGKTIPDYTFRSVTHLNAIIIPSTITTIGIQAFVQCTGLTSFIIPSSVTSIEDSAFVYCTGLTTITIPSSVTTIKYFAFADCSSLKSIYVNTIVPVNLSNSMEVFNSVNKSTCSLYVPAGSLAAYQAANQWKDFTHIIEMGASNVKTIPEVNIVLSPNPTTSSFSINNEGSAKIDIFGLNGNLVLSTTINGKEAISVSKLSAGIYTVKIITDGGVVTKQLIIE